VVEKLRGNGRFEVVGVASDGLEAVLKAAELHPDLVLLDIGMPKLNGIEALRQIREIAPQSRILFLSQELDPVLVQIALGAGGHGYVAKLDAERELFTAVEAVMLGKKFVSPRLLKQPPSKP
jgi:DNA-binding NarL/FixJ family response regulator